MNTEVLGVIAQIVLMVVLSYPLGKYIAKVYKGEKTWSDFMKPVERVMFKLSGINPNEEMNWKQFLRALLVVNLFWFLWGMVLLVTQGVLPLNPDGNVGQTAHQAFNTCISFMVNKEKFGEGLIIRYLRTIKIRKMRITKKRSPRLILQSLVKNGCPYIIICIWCVLSGGCVQNKSQDSLKTLKTEIRHIIKDKKATIGVALILDGEDTLAINNAEKYPMMSVYKFHQALAVCDYLQKRHIPLSTSLYLDKKYFKPDTYSPLRDKYPQGNLELPISELLVYTQSSDNVACDILFDYIGGVNVVDEYIHSLGINDVSITATEDEMHQDMDDCYKNWTTPMEAANLLELFMTQDFMRNEYTDFLKHIMIECGTGKDRLPAPLPESEVKIGHKTGTSDKNDRGEYIGINDIGFVILPDGSRYVVAVFVKDSKENMETNAKIISDISAAVYRYAGNR